MKINEANDLNVRSKDAEPEAPALEGWTLASAIRTEEMHRNTSIDFNWF